MTSDRKARWRKEIEWLLSVTDHIVEFVPSQQTAKDGTTMEVGTLILSLFLLPLLLSPTFIAMTSMKGPKILFSLWSYRIICSDFM